MITDGQPLYDLTKRLFPICRSITGNGVRETLSILQEHIPLTQHEVPSGTAVFDWTVPDEWNIRDAYIKNPKGKKIVDFQENNLHVLGYSEPINTKLSLEELKENLYTLPDQPNAIPYVTSYYKRRWGFCLTHEQFEQLEEEEYEVVIDSTLEPGHLTYGELIVEGQTSDEILLTTHVCHPSMANNELSGPVIATYLAKHLLELEQKPKYTYRFLFLTETIGAITYLSKHIDHLKQNVKGGYVLTCLGAPGHYSYLHTRKENQLTDRATKHVLKNSGVEFKEYSYLTRGSDERQFNAPGVDLNLGSLMKVKYAEFPEYHTSKDDLDFVTVDALYGSYEMFLKCFAVLELNDTHRMTVLCEPQLGKYGLFPSLSAKDVVNEIMTITNLIGYLDGEEDLIWLADKMGKYLPELEDWIKKLLKAGLIEKV